MRLVLLGQPVSISVRFVKDRCPEMISRRYKITSLRRLSKRTKNCDFITQHYPIMDNENLSNCWKTLKTIKPQRKDEISLSVTVVKTEKINCMRTRSNPLFSFLMGNQQRSPEKGNAQRLGRKSVEPQAIGGSKW